MRFTDITELIRQYEGKSRIDPATNKPIDYRGKHLGGQLIIKGLTVHFADDRDYYIVFLDSKSIKKHNKKHS